MHAIDVVAEKLQLSKAIVERIIQLIEIQECTIPFIARYRKEQTNNMEADKLREFIDALKEIRDIEKKADVMIKKIEKQGLANDQLKKSFQSARSIDELNHLFAPYKGDQKHSLADRARTLGLDEAALMILNYPERKVNLRDWVKKGTEGLGTLSEVEKGVRYLIADRIAKHQDTLDAVRKIFQTYGITLHSKVSASKVKEAQTVSTAKSVKPSKGQTQSPNEKYKIYFNFQCRVSLLKSYQVLAINRGEAQKQLTVKLVIDEEMEKKFLSWCRQRWVDKIAFADIKKLVNICIEDSHKRLIKPLVLRRTRSDLTKFAHLASIEVFRRNLKKLLLTSPVRNKTVLGIDPGYSNGCKCAVVSATGSVVLNTCVFNLRNRKHAAAQIRDLYEKHKFEIIAIGNGTACRDTEQFVSEFIRTQKISGLVYCIVSEDGASIYSVTDIAQKEMPDLDPNLRSAVSIARRLQDPLVELVKIEPKHLGVGMYQHDIPDSLMKASLSDVVEDCVTFVGVELNVAGPSLLKRIAGLKPAQAEKIIKWREKNGKFVNRQQLLQVPGIGEKTFQQCAGFVRIAPSSDESHAPVNEDASDSTTNDRKRKISTKNSVVAKKRKLVVVEPDYLDQTWIHPESYDVTRKFLKLINCCETDIGKPHFTSRIKAAKNSIGRFANELSVGEPTLQLIVEGLAQPCGYRDLRQESSKPLYRSSIRSMGDLRRGDVLQGRVTNVTDFGVFVDLGVGQDGLIHISKIRDWFQVKENIGPNDVVNVAVLDITNKLALSLVSHTNHLATLH